MTTVLVVDTKDGQWDGWMGHSDVATHYNDIWIFGNDKKMPISSNKFLSLSVTRYDDW